MYKSILKIIPKIEESDLRKMERSLSQRFKRVAKTFGSGLTSVLKGGAIGAIAIGLINKVLNPLKEVQEIIERTLSSNDDIATYAQQFNTTSGKLQKMLALAQSSGLSPQDLFTLITKYQTAVAEAANNPKALGYDSVKNYIGKADTVEGFFEFLQGLQKLDKNQQVYVQELIFGQKMILKMADFFQTNFAERYSALSLNKISTKDLTERTNRAAAISDYNDLRSARNDIFDRYNKAGLVNKGMVDEIQKRRQLEQERENIRIGNFKNLAAMSSAMDKIGILVEEGVAKLGKFIDYITPHVEILADSLKKFVNLPFFKRWFGGN